MPPVAATARSDRPGARSGTTIQPAFTLSARPAAYAAVVVRTIPDTSTANATVNSTGAAMAAVRRVAVNAPPRTSIPIAPPGRRSGERSSRTSGPTTTGASTVAPATSAITA